MAKLEEDVDEAPKKKKKSKLLLIIILLIILGALGGGGYYAYLKFFKHPPAETAEQAAEGEQKPAEGEKKAEKKEEKKDEKKAEGSGEKKDDKNKPVTSINNIVTNLADPGGRRYVRISVDFDFKDSHAAEEFTSKYQARIKDAILTLLWSKTSQDLSSVEGMLDFRTELQNRVNQIMGPGTVRQVFVTDRVIQ